MCGAPSALPRGMLRGCAPGWGQASCPHTWERYGEITPICSCGTPAATAACSSCTTMPASPPLHSASPATAVGRQQGGQVREQQGRAGTLRAVHVSCSAGRMVEQRSRVCTGHMRASQHRGQAPESATHLIPWHPEPLRCRGTARGVEGPAPPAARGAAPPPRQQQPQAAAAPLEPRHLQPRGDMAVRLAAHRHERSWSAGTVPQKQSKHIQWEVSQAGTR